MFRDPKQRLLSAYAWKRQFFLCDALTAECAGRNRGLYANMLAGNWSGAPRARVAYPDAATLREALRRLELFAFVGLVERWTDSMCLFRATFGGARPASSGKRGRDARRVAAASSTVRGRVPPAGLVARGDLFNVRPGLETARGAAPPRYDAAAAPGDPADDRVYAAAVRLFERRFADAFDV